MDIRYSSTRGGESGLTASQAILKGLAEDGGLFMPDHFPRLERSLEEMTGLSYQETAYEVMKLFFTDFTDRELRDCIERAYDSKFDTEEIAPLREADGRFYLELFHGKTIAFKDMALSILPHLMTVSAAKNKAEQEIVILTATSGDTGKAAMAGFADVPGTRIIVFYPLGGVSRVQELQMLTQKGENTAVVGISGNFDDAQSGVKTIFGDKAFAGQLAARGYRLSSANSINIGRLVPQVVYYVYAYTRLLRDGRIHAGEPVNFCVPTGNFGNILAACYAKKIGVPVHRLICASNDNKVLYDFFSTGTYDRNRPFILTSSPSMDILVSSNLERLLYLADGCDGNKTRELMELLQTGGRYQVTPAMREAMKDFVGGYATEQENAAEIRRVYEKTGYVIDTHTGVASAVYEKYRKNTGDGTKTVVVSTASPYKFVRSVMAAVGDEETRALTGAPESAEGDERLFDRLETISGSPIPPAIREIQTAAIRHHRTCDPAGMENEVAEILGLDRS